MVTDVARSVSPVVAANCLPEFFWSHFEHDALMFAKSMGRNLEDSVVICHQLLNSIVTSQGNQYG